MKKLFASNSWERTLYIMLFVQLVSAMGFSIIFPFFPLYVQHLGTNTSYSLEFWAGMVFSVQGMSQMFAAPVWGLVADRFGRKLMVQRATFGGAILILLMGFVRTSEELAVLRFLQGFVTGVVPAGNALVAAAVPRERTGYAMGILQTGLWSGVAAGPLIGGFMADTWGFRSAFVTTAILLFLAGLLVWFGINEVFEPRAKTKRVSPISEWRSILFAPSVGPVYAARMLSWLARTILVPILPLFILALMPASTRVSTFTGLVVGVSAAAGTACAIYFGRLGDRIGHRQVLIGCAFGAAIFYGMEFFVTEVWHLFILHALAGAATGGVMPAVSALLSQYTQPGQEGAVYGLDSSVGAAARASAPLIGAGIALWLGMAWTFVVTGVLFVLIATMAIGWLPNYKKAAQPQVA